MRLTETRLGELTCRIVDGPGAATPDLLVVLCHGFGAPGTDLEPLASELMSDQPALREGVRFVFPAGPLSLEGLGFGDARAWWPIDVERFVRAAQLGGPAAVRALRGEVPEGMASARRLLRAALDELLRATGLTMSRVVLGGFSQGSMLATDVALRLEEAPAALAVLSGTLIAEPEWRRVAPMRQGLRVLQTHGRFDPILPFDNALALRELFEEAGLAVDFRPFDGPHTISHDGLGALGELLADLRSGR